MGVDKQNFRFMISDFRIILLTLFLLAGVGCQGVSEITQTEPKRGSKSSLGTESKSPVVLPLDGLVAGYDPSYRRFGEYFEGRFVGYHVAEDSEVRPEDLGPGEVQEVPIRAIADGEVIYKNWVSGYGGVVLIAHDVEGKKINAIYGHLDIGSVNLEVGDRVRKAQFIANLGEDKSRETDGERQHLHFALYEGDEIRLQGYERNLRNVENWINPRDFFAGYGIINHLEESRLIGYSNLTDPEGKKIFSLDFFMPSNWDVEYIPSIESLNLYKTNGPGTARDRSQILIRYFDANKFLTLSSVNVFSAEDYTVGAGCPTCEISGYRESYVGKRYDIEKKSGVADFSDQPSWRNERHVVTDFREKEGFTRYYVVAANPELDKQVYEDFLASINILKL